LSLNELRKGLHIKVRELTFIFYIKRPLMDVPSLDGRGCEGEGEKRLLCPPPPEPSPIEGRGIYFGNFEYLWIKF
jgi:hypothetical protein